MKKEKQHIDLFEDYENIPSNIQKILDKYEDAFMDGSYDGLLKAHKAVNKLGYTFEYYLDGQAYGLRPNDVPLNKLKGYEDEPDEMANGGNIDNEVMQEINKWMITSHLFDENPDTGRLISDSKFKKISKEIYAEWDSSKDNYTDIKQYFNQLEENGDYQMFLFEKGGEIECFYVYGKFDENRNWEPIKKFTFEKEAKNFISKIVEKGVSIGGFLMRFDDYKISKIKSKNWEDSDITKMAKGGEIGNIIGKTKNGNLIYENANNQNHNKFSKEEHLEAVRLHRKLQQQWARKREPNAGYIDGKPTSEAVEKTSYHGAQMIFHQQKAKQKGGYGTNVQMAKGGYVEGREEHRGWKYIIWYNPNKGAYSVSDSNGVFDEDNNYFKTFDKAKEHAEISISSMIDSDEMAKGGNIEDSGLMVIGRTTIDNTRIGDIIEQNDFYAEWNPNEEFWFFPEEVENYDGLEQQLEELFIEEGINARFEGIFAKGGSIDEDLITFITDNAMPSISISISEEDVIREAKAYFKWRKDVTVKKIRSLGSSDYDKFITHLSKKGYKYSPKYEKGGSVDKIKKGDSVYYIRQFTAGKIVGVVIDIDKDGKYANVRNTIGDIDYVPVNALKKYVKQQLSKFKNNMITANEIDNVHEWVGLDFSKEQIKEVFDAIEEYTGYDYPKDFKTNASPFNDFEPAHKKVDEIFESLSIAALEGDDLTESDIRDILWGIVMSAQNKYEKGGNIDEKEIEKLVEIKKRRWYSDAGAMSVMIDDMPEEDYGKVIEGFRKEAIEELSNKKMATGGNINSQGRTREEKLQFINSKESTEALLSLKQIIKDKLKIDMEFIDDTSSPFDPKKALAAYGINAQYIAYGLEDIQKEYEEWEKKYGIEQAFTYSGDEYTKTENLFAYFFIKEYSLADKKMATGGEIEFSPVAVEEANLEQLFDMAKELGLTNFQNLNKEVLRKKILEHFKLNRFRGKMATGGEVILKRDGYFKNENGNEYIEKINNYYNKWRNINTEKDSENFKKIKPPVFGTYGDKNILEQINHFEKLGVPLYDNFVMRNSFKNEISKIIPYSNNKMATGGEIKNITKQLDDLGVKYTLSKSNFRLFDEIIKPIDKEDSFYDKFNRIIQLYNLEGVVRTKMATGGEVLGRNIKFKDYSGETRNGVITESLDGGNFAVSSGFGSILVTPEMVISFDEKPQEVKKKLFGFFEEGGNIQNDIAVIYIDEYPYYLKKLGDSTHFNMSNSKEGVDLVIPSHIGQHSGTPYYNDIRSWLKGGESPDGKRYIDKLKDGGTIPDADKKSDGRFLNKISNRVDKVWDMIGAKSGGQIRSDKEMLGSYAEKALIEVEKLGLKKNSLTSKDFAFFTNRNDHLLNEFLVWNNFYYTKFAKKEKLNYLDLFKEYPLSYCDPSIIKVVTDDEKYIPHSKIDSITVIIDGKKVRIQGKDVLNGANR